MIRKYFLYGLILSTALVDVLGNISTGTISLNGIYTVVVAAVITLLLLGRARLAWRGLIQIWPFSALLFYSGLQCVVSAPSMQGLQNICILWIFVGSIVLILIARNSEMDRDRIVRTLLWAVALASIAYAISILYDGLGTEVFIGARSFALYALFGLGLLLARWAHGSRTSFWLAVALILLVALSLSRTCLVVGVLLFPLARMRSVSYRDIKRIAFVCAVAAFGLYYAVVSIDALRVRFLGNNSIADILVGDASIETSGRIAAWILTFNSFRESPWLGKGPGSADDLNGVAFADRRGDSQVELAHPLNEYLRFLHDEGILGLCLALAGYAKLLILCRKTYLQSVECSAQEASIYLGTCLSLVAVLLTMLTDNTASYLFMVAPLGILVGVTLKAHPQMAPEFALGQTAVASTAKGSQLATTAART